MGKIEIYNTFADDFNGDAVRIDWMKRIFNAISTNDVGGLDNIQDAYSLSLDPTGVSGYSIGWLQNDFYQQRDNLEFKDVVSAALDRMCTDQQLTELQRNSLFEALFSFHYSVGENGNVYIPEDLQGYYDTVQGFKAKLNTSFLQDTLFQEQIDNLTIKEVYAYDTRVRQIIDGTGATGDYLSKGNTVKDYLNRSDLAKLLIIDYDNQYNFKEEGLFDQFLANENSSFGIDDMLRYYLNTSSSKSNPEDSLRRFSNLVEELGTDHIELTEEESSFFKNELQSIVGDRFQSIFLTPDNQGLRDITNKESNLRHINAYRVNNDLILEVDGTQDNRLIENYFSWPGTYNGQGNVIEVLEGIVWDEAEVNRNVQSVTIQGPTGQENVYMAQAGNDLVIGGEGVYSPVIVKNYYDWANNNGTMPTIRVKDQIIQNSTVTEKVNQTNADITKFLGDEFLTIIKDEFTVGTIIDMGQCFDEKIPGVYTSRYNPVYGKILTSEVRILGAIDIFYKAKDVKDVFTDESAFKRYLANVSILSWFAGPEMGLFTGIVTTGLVWYYDSRSEEERRQLDNVANDLLILSPFEWIHDLFESSELISPPRSDPFVLDLDGDGIETTGVSDGIYFDIDNSGFAEKTAWVKSDDGLLVLDRNGDGVINNGTELFGDRTPLRDGSIAASGFQALMEFDDNQDQKIDLSDAVYTKLRVWRDRGNGNSDSEELFTLEQLGIKSIGLNAIDKNEINAEGNIEVRTTTYEKIDGTTGGLGEFLFQTDPLNSSPEQTVDIPANIKQLPNIEGSGNIYSLQQAMARDTSGRLKELVLSFSNEESTVQRNKLIDEILLVWTGSTEINKADRGANFDAQKLAVMEKFFGTQYRGVDGSNPNVNSAVVLNRAYSGLVETIYSQLMAQTHLKSFCNGISFKWNDTLNDFTADLTQVEGMMEVAISDNEVEGKILLSEFVRMIRTLEIGEEINLEEFNQYFSSKGEEYAWIVDSAGMNTFEGTLLNDNLSGTDVNNAMAGGNGDDAINGNGGNDLIYGQGGYDTLYGGDGDDKLDGGSGDDTLYGGNGSDILIGGSGRDYLEGGSGSDVYVFGRGDGQDTIYDYDFTDNNSDKILLKEGILPSDILLSRRGSDLELTIKGTNENLLVRYFFDNSKTYQIEKIEFAEGSVWDLAAIKEAVRYIEGSELEDNLQGFESNDVINGKGGNDSIYGYNGNDQIDGGAGNDNLGGESGNDTLLGSAGEDRLYGGLGDDVLDGGAGVDYLEGNDGSDTYVFGRGDGFDTISNINSTPRDIDTLSFREGVLPGDILVQRVDYNLRLSIKDTGDQIEISNYFYSDDSDNNRYKIAKIEFANGALWDVAYVKQEVAKASEENDFIRGYEQNDSFIGLEGDDVIYGYAGNDVLDGGLGNDMLYGGEGNDTLIGGDEDDNLYGENGEDFFDGGLGNDRLEGSSGNDTYMFGRGYGQDIIYEYDNTFGNLDKIMMADDILPSDISIKRDGGNLELGIKGTVDKLIVSNYFSDYHYKVEKIEFKAGTVWDTNYIMSIISRPTSSDDFIQGYETNDVLFGQEGDDTIYGYAGSDLLEGGPGKDVLYGGDGNDTLTGGVGDDLLYGEQGEDTLDGGSGNDRLEGSAGNDTYIFGRGYGQDAIGDYDYTPENRDKIVMATDIRPSDITVKRNQNSLELSINDTLDKLTVSEYFSRDAYKIEKIEFSEGTVWDVASIKDGLKRGTEGDDLIQGYESDDVITAQSGNDTIYGYAGNDLIEGGAGNDILYGDAGADTLDGGAGNDRLEGSSGNDAYVFGRGYGQDVISEYDYPSGNLDKIMLATDLLPSDIAVRRDSNSLELSINGTEDKITVSNYFSNDAYKIETIEFADGTVWDQDWIKESVIKGTEVGELLRGYETNDVIAGQGGNDTLYGGDGDDTLSGGTGDDILYGEQGNNQFFGEDGNDKLYGNTGEDILDGGAGEDRLEGSSGNDTYIFGHGYGQDVILDYDYTVGNLDKIVIAKDIMPSDITLRKNGNDLELSINATNDKLTVSNFFNYDYYKVENIEFSDGTVWDAEYIGNVIADALKPGDTLKGSEVDDEIIGQGGNEILYGYAGNDSLEGGLGNDGVYGGDGNDTLTGGAGDDTLYGEKGEDTLEGGAGNDRLEGSYGKDTYIFGRGYGQDVIYDYDYTLTNLDRIRMATDLSPSDINLKRNGNSLELSINGTGDKLTVSEYFSDDAFKIEKIEFTDGTVWEDTYVKVAVTKSTEADDLLKGYEKDDILSGQGGNDTIYGNAGNDVIEGGEGDDTLYGDYGDDTLDGGAGNDRLEGSYGNDTYIFGRGYGQDVIIDYDYTPGNLDKIRMAADILPSDISVKKSGYNLELSLNGTADKLTVSNYFANDSNKVEKIEFVDGTVWDAAQIKEAISRGSETDDQLEGYETDDTLVGQGGNDTIYGNAGNDLLQGGTGDDTLYGGDGEDILDGGAGNDRLEGYSGNDIYLFGRGYGQDVILDYDYSSDNLDKIVLTEDIHSSDVSLKRTNNSLELSVKGTADKLTVSEYFSNEIYKIEEITFADGTIWGIDQIKEIVTKGTEADDSLVGYEGDDTLVGHGGQDIVYSNEGNDFIDGGTGDDNLYGGDGDDQLIGATGNDILYGEAGDDHLLGGNGNDNLYGGAGEDILDGGAGTDRLEGAEGNDTYLFGRGYGEDEIRDYDATLDNIDKIVVAADLISTEVSLKRDGDSLELSVNGTADKLTVREYFYTDGYKVEKIEFADGSVWDDAKIRESVTKGTEVDDNLRGFEVDDTLVGFGGNDTIYGYAGNDKIDAGPGDDSANGGDGDDVIIGGTGEDNLYGEDGNDTLKGGKGNDRLYGYKGNDILDSESGNDYMEGGAGDDTYLFGKGYGQDTILDYDTTDGSSDRIVMSERVLPVDVQARRNGSDLELTLKGTSNTLTVSNYFDSTDFYKVEKIEFADGTVWDTSYINDVVQYIYGSEFNEVLQGYDDNDIIRGFSGNDYLFGNDGDDTLDGGEGTDQLDGGNGMDILRGGAGDDNLRGNSGDDILDGGSGNDFLEGNDGNDTFIFGKGYDQDIISDYDSSDGKIDSVQMVEGILPIDVQLGRNKKDLEIMIKGTNDRLTINNYFYSDAYKIDRITFTEGTVWDTSHILEAVRNITGDDQDENLYGYEGNDLITGGGGYETLLGYDGDDRLEGAAGDDTLYGGNGDDTLIGGEEYDKLYGQEGNDTLDGGVGNDRLEGGYGSDTYVFDKGYGQDQIYEYDSEPDNSDVISVAGNILPDDVIVVRNGSRLELLIRDTADKLTIQNYFDYAPYSVEKVQFEDGTIWDETMLKNKARFIDGTSQDDTIDSFYDYNQDNVINGMSGDDSLTGNRGNDTLNGGEGDDKLYGGAGSDLLEGGTGNDYLEGGEGNDTYLFGRGMGLDTVVEYDRTSGNVDSIQFLGTVLPSDVKIIKVNDNSLELNINGSEDSIIVRDYFNSYSVEQVLFANGTVWNKDYIEQNILYIKGSVGNDYINASTSDDRIHGLEGDDYIYGNDGDDTLEGDGGNDRIDGGNGNDKLLGGEGDDVLYGLDSMDTLDGGLGNDSMNGGNGNDTYVFNRGYGQDTINDFDQTVGNVDTIALGEGILPENLVLSQQGNTLELKIDGTEDKLSINGYFENYFQDSYKIEQIQFPNGEVWEQADLQNQSFSVYGTEYGENLSFFSNVANVMYGYGGNDKLTGGEGNDELFGGMGDDIQNGGSGKDQLFGEEGDDVLDGGDGNDSLDGGIGDNLLMGGNGDDTLLGGKGNDKLYGGAGIDQLDGGAGNDVLDGGSGNDTLRAGLGDDLLFGDIGEDILDGGTGNDLLSGGMGNDTYIFNKGYGSDTLSDYDYSKGNIDTVIFGEGITPENIAISRIGNNLELSLEGTPDKLTLVNGYFDDSYGYYAIEKFQFSNGTVWNSSDFQSGSIFTYGTQGDDLVTYSTGVKDIMYGYGGNDTLYGADGEDIIYGGEGIDYLDGGDGNDKLFGEEGNDSLYGGNGDDLFDSGVGNDYLDGGSGADDLKGGEGNDTLYGGEGTDLLNGQGGNDYLDGGSGNDTYIFEPAFGTDTISDFDYVQGNKDTVYFGEDILNIIFAKKENSLEVQINGTEDVLNIDNFYSSSSYQIEEFKAAGDLAISNVQVDQLIQAVASFTQQDGVSWSQAIQNKPQEVQDILSQFWVHQAS